MKYIYDLSLSNWVNAIAERVQLRNYIMIVCKTHDFAALINNIMFLQLITTSNPLIILIK